MSANVGSTDAGSGGGAVTDSGSAITAPEITAGQTFDDVFRFTHDELNQISIVGEDENEEGQEGVKAESDKSDQGTAGTKEPDQTAAASIEKTDQAAAEADKSQQPSPLADALVESVHKIGGPDAVTIFTPLFQGFDVDSQEGLDAATDAGRNFIEKLSEYDPAAAAAALYGIYHTFEPLLTQWIDSKRGVTPELIEEAKNGSARPDESDFPKPDANNLVTLPEIGELYLTDKQDKAVYDLAKSQYDRTRADERKAAEDKAKTDRDAELTAERKRDEAEKAFGKGRLHHLAQTFDSLKLNYGDEYNWLIPDIRAAIVQGVLARNLIEHLSAPRRGA